MTATLEDTDRRELSVAHCLAHSQVDPVVMGLNWQRGGLVKSNLLKLGAIKDYWKTKRPALI